MSKIDGGASVNPGFKASKAKTKEGMQWTKNPLKGLSDTLKKIGNEENLSKTPTSESRPRIKSAQENIVRSEIKANKPATLKEKIIATPSKAFKTPEDFTQALLEIPNTPEATEQLTSLVPAESDWDRGLFLAKVGKLLPENHFPRIPSLMVTMAKLMGGDIEAEKLTPLTREKKSHLKLQAQELIPNAWSRHIKEPMDKLEYLKEVQYLIDGHKNLNPTSKEILNDLLGELVPNTEDRIAALEAKGIRQSNPPIDEAPLSNEDPILVEKAPSETTKTDHLKLTKKALDLVSNKSTEKQTILESPGMLSVSTNDDAIFEIGDAPDTTTVTALIKEIQKELIVLDKEGENHDYFDLGQILTDIVESQNLNSKEITDVFRETSRLLLKDEEPDAQRFIKLAIFAAYEKTQPLAYEKALTLDSKKKRTEDMREEIENKVFKHNKRLQMLRLIMPDGTLTLDSQSTKNTLKAFRAAKSDPSDEKQEVARDFERIIADMLSILPAKDADQTKAEFKETTGLNL